VVAAARDEDNILHRYFQWDDSKAAAEHRLRQARQLIVRVQVNLPSESVADRQVQRFVSLVADRRTEEGGYRDIVTVMRNTDQREQFLSQAKTELQRVADKYRTLSELVAVIREIDKLIPPKTVADAKAA
jgi:hypothetical protein